jgi:hypothetical protein
MIKKEAKRAARAKKALDEYEARRATYVPALLPVGLPYAESVLTV